MLNHRGKHFTVRGPLNVSRSPQGRPVVAQAGSSDVGMDLAAPSGCRFRDRCPRAMARCAEEVPPLRPVGAGHQVACHLDLA